MTNYKEYNYIFPPRAEAKITAKGLDTYDNGSYIAQPKYNGSCCNVFLNDGRLVAVMNRHNEDKTRQFADEIDYAGMYRGTGFMVLSGELLDKNKTGEDGKPFNKKFVIWDILVYQSVHLIGETMETRLALLHELYGDCCKMMVGAGTIEQYDHLCITGIRGVYRAPSYNRYFTQLYENLVKTDLYEGLVLKRLSAPLQYGFNSSNNAGWQLKCRKATKNYLF